MESFGKRMADLRHERGYSQNALSKLTGMKQTTISAIEQREYTPRGEVLEIISQALGVEMIYWFQSETYLEPEHAIICPMCGHHLNGVGE